jgi:L-ascorbate metabolism protein UlaG (beta-lactamase superfamily)
MAKRQRGKRFAILAGTAALAYWVAKDIPRQMGAKASGARLARMEASPQYADGQFQNSVPSSVMAPMSRSDMFSAFMRDRERRHPRLPIPVVHEAPVRDAEGLHVTWLGHSSALVEIEGHRVLLDPVWSERCSPSALVGPKRMHEPPVALRDLPPLDAVVISHDHYDHLDMPTIQNLADLQGAPFLVPLGVGAHLERWGVPSTRIIELDWNETHKIGGLEFVSTAARHFSGRGFARNETLWSSWVINGPTRKVFYSGDTGYFPGFADVGAEHGPFDVTLVQVGAYADGWPDIHMTPEDGVAAHLDVRGGLMIPVHWGTFVLAMHEWPEPADRTWQEAKARDVRLAVPRPGERVDVDNPPAVDGWWQQIA